jgi:hypothetical protein
MNFLKGKQELFTTVYTACRVTFLLVFHIHLQITWMNIYTHILTDKKELTNNILTNCNGYD